MSHVIPVTIIDDFFEDPNLIRSFALEQEFKLAEDLKWPGFRTACISTLNIELFDHINKRFLLSFYDEESVKGIQIGTSACFQSVPSNMVGGWVHRDDSLISGIVYLSPNAHPDSGTSIYKRKTSTSFIKNSDLKQQSIQQQQANIVAKEDNNDQFRETITVKNEYNRLIAFDGCSLHAAGSFEGTDLNDSRLTLVFFVHGLIHQIPNLNHYPAQRRHFF